MKRFTIIAVLLGFCVVSLLLTRPAPADQQGEKKTGVPAKLEQLQKERIDAFEKIVKILEAQYKVGTTTFAEFVHAQEDLIKAKLEATDKPAERIALLEEQLKIAKGFLKSVEGQYKVGFARVSEADVLRVKARCLTIEIKLTKERDKAKPAG